MDINRSYFGYVALSSTIIFHYKIDFLFVCFSITSSYEKYEMVTCTRKTSWLLPLVSSSGGWMVAGQVNLPRDALVIRDRAPPEGGSEHDCKWGTLPLSLNLFFFSTSPFFHLLFYC